VYGEQKPLRRDRLVGVGRETAIETAALLATESPAVARWGVRVCGASIARLGAPGEWRSGSGSERGVALKVLRAEDVDIGEQWSVTATMEIQHSAVEPHRLNTRKVRVDSGVGR
jgi:hypothetical protein